MTNDEEAHLHPELLAEMETVRGMSDDEFLAAHAETVDGPMDRELVLDGRHSTTQCSASRSPV